MDIDQIDAYNTYQEPAVTTAKVAISLKKVASIALFIGSSVGGIAGGVMFLIKFMNTVEFFSLFVFFNTDYSKMVTKILSEVYDIANERMIPNDFNNYSINETDNVWIYKQKLTEYGVPPFLFEDSGPEIFAIVIIYTITFFMTFIDWFLLNTGKIKFYVYKLRMSFF